MIELHADDYGLFFDQSKKIARLVKRGVINGVSVMVNNPEDLAKSMKLINGCSVKYVLHLNFVEGRALASDVKMLTGREGVFAPSFGKFLIYSYIPIVRRRLLKQIKREISAQIKEYRKYVDGDFMVDGHCHYHMIPVVFDALMDVIKEEGIEASTIRFPAEKLKLYFIKRHIPRFSAINLVKTYVLKVLARRNRIRHSKALKDVFIPDFMGVSYSGALKWRKLKHIALKLIKTYASDDRYLEILFHPGGVTKKEEIERITNESDLAFLTSPNRIFEGRAAIRFDNMRREVC